jgi:hypothetical protein
MMRLDDRVKPTNHVVQQEIDEGIALLNMRTADCFELDPIGARLWAALRTEQRLRAVFEAVLAEYDVPPDVLEKDVLALVGKLMAAGVLERCEA